MSIENVTTNFLYVGLSVTRRSCARRNFWLSSIAIQPCSDPQSVFRRMGQTPCFLTARKYKAIGTTGLLFDFTTVSHKTFYENPSTAP